jgi:hypothetical protein
MDLRKIVPNAKQTILWSYKVWTDMDPQIIRNCCRKSRILPPDWSADFANEDQRKKIKTDQGVRRHVPSYIKTATWIL